MNNMSQRAAVLPDLLSESFDLPSPKTRIWTSRRKAAVMLAISDKAISVWDACERYSLSAEELAEWQRNLDRFGVPGLRTTRISIYRKTSKPK
jgi:hypothetical protein